MKSKLTLLGLLTMGFATAQNVVGRIESSATTFDIKVNNTTRIAIKGTDGNVGIGTVNPTEKLEVLGNIKSSSLANQGNSTVYADNNGKLYVDKTKLGSVVTDVTLVCDANTNNYVYAIPQGTLKCLNSYWYLYYNSLPMVGSWLDNTSLRTDTNTIKIGENINSFTAYTSSGEVSLSLISLWASRIK